MDNLSVKSSLKNDEKEPLSMDFKKQTEKLSQYSANPYFANESNNEIYVLNESVGNYEYVLNRKYQKGFEHILEEQTSVPKKDKLSNCKGQKVGDLLISKRQEDRLKQEVFTDRNLNQYASILMMYDKKETPLKSQFLVNLIIDNNLQGNVLKYDEDMKLFKKVYTEEIYKYLEENFSKKTRTMRRNKNKKQTTKKTKSIEKATSSSSCTKKTLTTHQSDHPLRNYLMYGNKFYKMEHYQDSWFNKVMKGMNEKETDLNKYTKNEYIEEKSHSMYSVIHPLFEEYELILYNGSHRLAYPIHQGEHTCVHSCSRIKLKIPAPSPSTGWKTFFVIFNSKLVHCGSKAYRESCLSAHHRFNFRLFTYAIQSYQGTRSKLSPSVNEDDKNADNFIVQNTRTESIDHTTFELCDPYQCETCKKIKEKETVIDVENEYTRKGSKSMDSDIHHSIRPSSYVCGDLDEHGWEVHVGVDYMNSTVQFKYLRYHLETLFYSGTKTHWSEVVNSGGRSFMRLDTMIKSNNRQFLASRKYLVQVISKELSDILMNIRGFKNHTLQGRILFVNRGICREQLPHRDYKPLPLNTTTSIANTYSENDSIHSEWVEQDHTTQQQFTTGATRSSTRRCVRTSRFSPGKGDNASKKRKLSKNKSS